MLEVFVLCDQLNVKRLGVSVDDRVSHGEPVQVAELSGEKTNGSGHRDDVTQSKSGLDPA